MKNEMYLNVTLTFLFVCLMAGTTFAQLTTNDGYIYFPNQSLYGDNNSALSWKSNNSNASQLTFEDKEGSRYGRVLGNGNGLYFGLTDGDNNWTFFTKKDEFSAFRINNSEKMRILANGRVGIGTSDPQAKLHVTSGIRTAQWNDATEYMNIYHSGFGKHGVGGMYFAINNQNLLTIANSGNVGIGTNTPAVKLHSTGTVRASNSPDNLEEYLEIGHGGWNSYINHKGNGSINFRFQGTNKMVLAPNGRLGIGIDAPTQALEVNGNIRLPDADGNTKGSIYLGGITNGEEIGMRLYGGDVGDGNEGSSFPGGFIDVVTADAADGLRFRVDQHRGSAERMRIRADGKVLIGTGMNTPGNYKLYVDNGILTEKVKVATVNSGAWADYVFAEDYDLNSTEEVAAFIKENKHLPNVPSAEDVSKNGVDMVEMDATLLRQIEELWLHVIELKKENEALKEEVKTLSNK